MHLLFSFVSQYRTAGLELTEREKELRIEYTTLLIEAGADIYLTNRSGQDTVGEYFKEPPSSLIPHFDPDKKWALSFSPLPSDDKEFGDCFTNLIKMSNRWSPLRSGWIAAAV